MKLKNFLTKAWSFQTVRYISFGIFFIFIILIIMRIGFSVGLGIINEITSDIVQNREWKYETTGLHRIYIQKKETDRSIEGKSDINNESKERKLKTVDEIFSGKEEIINKRKRVVMQLLEIKARADHHLRICRNLYMNYYCSIIMVLICGIFAASLLTIISKNGWDKANRYLIIALVISSAFAVFFKALPEIFNYEVNINNSIKKYVEYVNLENRVFTYLFRPGEKKLGTDIQEITDFITAMDETLATKNSLGMIISFEKLPTQLSDIPGFSSSSAK